MSKEAKNLFYQFEHGLDISHSDDINAFIQEYKLSDESLKEFLLDTKYAKKDLASYNTYLKTTAQETSFLTKATKTASVALKSVGAALGSMAIMWAIGEAIAVAAAAIDKWNVTSEEYVEAQNALISKADENISKNNEEISSLENLQKKLESAKGDKSELNKISSELNKTIGNTPGLLNGEAKSWELANQKIKDRIGYYKELNEQELANKVSANKNIYENNGVDIDFGGIVKDFLFVSPFTNVENAISGNYGTFNFSQYSKYIQDWEEEYGKNFVKTVKKAVDKNGTSFADEALSYLAHGVQTTDYNWLLSNNRMYGNFMPTPEQFEKMMNQQFSSLQATFQQYIDNYSGSLSGLSFDTIIQNMVYGGIGLEQAQEQLMSLLDNDKLEGAFEDYQKSFTDDSFNTEELYNTIKTYFDGMKKSFPYASESIDTFFDQTINALQDKSAEIKTASGDLYDSFALNGADGKATVLGSISDEIDKIQKAYSNLKDAQTEFEENGAISVDTFQELVASGGQWLDYLVDENGNFNINEESLQNLTNARIADMKAQLINNMIDNVTKIDSEKKAMDFLAATNYETAKSYEALALMQSSVASSSLATQVANGTVSQQTADSVMSKLQSNISKINNITIDIGDTSIGEGSKKTKSGAKSSDTAKQFDFIEERLNDIDDTIDTVQTRLDDFVGSAAKNLQIDSLVKINGAKKSNLESAVKEYTDLANDELAKIPAQYQDMVQNGAIGVVDFMGSGNDEITEAISNYQKWSDKVTDCTKQLDELGATLRDLEKQKFDNIVDDYTKQLDTISTSKDKLESLIDLQEKQFGAVGSAIYEELISQTNTQLDYLNKEKSALEAQMTSSLANGIKIGSDEWDDMRSTISDIDSEIIDCTSSLSDFQDEINTLKWDNFDNLIDKFKSLNDEVENFTGLLNSDEVFENGSWTNDGIALLGLYSQQMELAQYQSKQYGTAIDELNTDYAKGLYTLEEYTEQLDNLKDGQWEAIDSYESAKKAIEDLHKARVEKQIEAIEEETDAYKRLTDARKADLQAMLDEKTENDDIADKQNAINSLKRQIAAMTGDTTSATVSQRLKLEEELVNAEKDLSDTKYKYDIEAQQEALDKSYDDYEKSQKAKTDTLKSSLEDVETLMQNSFEAVNNESNRVFETMTKLCADYGIKASDTIIQPWISGQSALGSYSSSLSAQTGSFISQLETIRVSTVSVQNQAYSTAVQLINTFSVTSGGLQNELASVYNGISADYGASRALYDSINNIFTGNGLDNNGIIGKFNAIKNAADEVSHTLAEMTTAQQQANNVDVVNHGYRIVDTSAGVVVSDLGSTPEMYAQNRFQEYVDKITFGNPIRKLNYKLERYSKGGVVGDGNFLSNLARSVGEDKMVAVKTGEGILTQPQTNALLSMAEHLPKWDSWVKNINIRTPDFSGINGTNTAPPNIIINSAGITVNGNADSVSQRDMQRALDESNKKIFTKIGEIISNV